jgi:DNA helicase-2/ATP-dependent DNA helicase PcrA
MPTTYEPSRYQSAIYSHTRDPLAGHSIIEAVAGSGKTSTLVEISHIIKGRSLFLAFNKHIAEALCDRISIGCEARTMHALGNAMCKKHLGWAKVNGDKVWNLLRYKILKDDPKKAYQCKSALLRIVSLAKANGFGVKELADNLPTIIESFDIEPPKTVEDFELLVVATYQLSLDQTTVIDFDDMIFLPIYHNLPFAEYDWILGDEAQDFNPVQAEMLSRLSAKGRAILVGDSHQAIYGFRGADSSSMQNLQQRFRATPLPLSICYRCPISVVAEAQKIVPQIEASATAIEGTVSDLPKREMRAWLEAGDYVLCRCTAPLVGECLEMIRQRRRATVRGKDIGMGLISLIEEICDKRFHVSQADFICALSEHMDKRRERAGRSEAKQAIIDDQQETLEIIAADCSDTGEMIRLLTEIFSENGGDGIVFSTIHRSKGLEAQRIFILRPDLLPHPRAKSEWAMQQEENLRYVAITRSLRELYYITD